MSKPLILVTNDDGIDSRGIRHLVEIMNHFGEVVIVAPDSPQSGMGHAITVGDKLRLVKSDLFDNDLDKNKFVVEKIKDNFDLSPKGIREMLNLNKPIYEKTAAYGHFGRSPEENGSFSWEKTDKVDIFKK